MPPIFPASNKLNITFAILQLAYLAAQAYLQYEFTIHRQGLSSPYLIAIPYLYMSFINMIANLVQGSYTHITIIPPHPSSINTSNTISVTPHDINHDQHESVAPGAVDEMVEFEDTEEGERFDGTRSGETTLESVSGDDVGTLATEIRSQMLAEEFDEWLSRSYPQIKIRESGLLS